MSSLFSNNMLKKSKKKKINLSKYLSFIFLIFGILFIFQNYLIPNIIQPQNIELYNNEKPRNHQYTWNQYDAEYYITNDLELIQLIIDLEKDEYDESNLTIKNLNFHNINKSLGLYIVNTNISLTISNCDFRNKTLSIVIFQMEQVELEQKMALDYH